MPTNPPSDSQPKSPDYPDPAQESSSAPAGASDLEDVLIRRLGDYLRKSTSG